MIERWLMAVRDHPERPPALQRHVLTMLALRLDWHTGRGYASTGQLAADSDARERTVRRATKWGRDTGHLLRTRRGHRISAETVIASEWQLTVPGYPQAETQPATGDLLESQPANGDHPTGQRVGANRSAGHHHQESVFHQDLSTSARAAGADAPRAGWRSPVCKGGLHELECGDPRCGCFCHAWDGQP